MKKFKKLMIAGLATVMAVGVMSSFAACSGKTELVVNTMFGGGDGHAPAFAMLNSSFLQANQDIRIKDKSGNPTGTSWKDDVQRDMASKNNVPDVVFMFSGAQMAAYQDKLVSVKDIQETEGYESYGKNIVSHDSDPYSLELKGFNYGLQIDADKLSGVDTSKWDELYAFFKANANAGYSASTSKALSARVDVPHYWFNVLMTKQLGTEEFNAYDGSKAFFTDAKKTAWKTAFYKVVGQMKEIGYGNAAASAPGKGESQEAKFYKGNASAVLDGSWSANSLNSSKISNWEVINVPGGDKDGKDFIMGGFTSGWYITKKAWNDPKKQKAAVDYVMWHTTDYAVGLYCQIAGGLPATGKPVTGATNASNAFAGLLVEGREIVMPLDDRSTQAAKDALLTNWTDDHKFAKLLLGTDAYTEANTDALFDAFIAALV